MSGKIGANGVFWTKQGEVELSGGRGDYEVHRRVRGRLDGPKIGRVKRERHIYRTPFAGKRYGYDREHWCWNGDWTNYVSGRRSLRCYRSMGEVIELLLRESEV